MKKIDLFKIFIVLIGLAFLYLFYDFSKNGRYGLTTTEGKATIIDTRTGELFLIIDPMSDYVEYIPELKNNGTIVPYTKPIIQPKQ